MTLADYLAQPGITASQLAKDCGVYPSTITRVARGEQWPAKTLMGLIVANTRGAVTPNDFLEERASQ